MCADFSCCAIFGNSGVGLLQARQWQQCVRPRVQLHQEEHFRKRRYELRQKRSGRRRLVRQTDFTKILPRLWSGIRGRQVSVYNSEFHFNLFVSYLPPLQLNDNDTILLWVICTLHSWVDPEFTDEEVTTSSNTETGGSFEEKVENRDIVDNKIFISIAKMGGLRPVKRPENAKRNIIW